MNWSVHSFLGVIDCLRNSVDHKAVKTRSRMPVSGYSLSTTEKIQREEYYVYLLIANAMRQGRRLYEHSLENVHNVFAAIVSSRVVATLVSLQLLRLETNN